MGQRIIEVRARIVTGPSWQAITLAEHTITVPADRDVPVATIGKTIADVVDALLADTNVMHGAEPLEPAGEFTEV